MIVGLDEKKRVWEGKDRDVAEREADEIFVGLRHKDWPFPALGRDIRPAIGALRTEDSIFRRLMSLGESCVANVSDGGTGLVSPVLKVSLYRFRGGVRTSKCLPRCYSARQKSVSETFNASRMMLKRGRLSLHFYSKI